MKAFSKDATIVLVHGAWADGSSWQAVIIPLIKAGLQVVCAPLPLTSLADDIAALDGTLKNIKGDVVLAGHAYGGAVIAGVRGDGIKGLVYIAALAPAEGETVAEVFFREKPHPLAPELIPDARGFIWMPESGFASAFAQNASSDRLTILNAVQRPISVKCIQEKAPVPGWKNKPSWFLVAAEDRMINPQSQRFMAQRMGATIRTSSVDHSPAITASHLVVDLLLEVANSTLKSG